MTKPIRLIINLPFPGFYYSDYSDGIDSEEERWIEYEGTEREEGEQQHPEHVRLNETELPELLFDCTDHAGACQQVARDDVEAFGIVAREWLGWDLGLAFESMSSPKFYNFETDRVFAFIPLKTARRLFGMSKPTGTTRSFR